VSGGGDCAVERAAAIELAPGLLYVPDYLDREHQEALLAQVRSVLRGAPLFRPTMPRSGTPFSVLMSNCGPLGWVSDRAGYRYASVHPETGAPWPGIPDIALETWGALAHYSRPPEACLINYYETSARMGLHQDRDEASLIAPVVSLSLGDTCLFRFGGTTRRGPTRRIKLQSGDALILGGESRLAFHGVDRILPGSSTLLPEGGRFNLTLRRVSADPLDA
jgi:DNA oxidative demethylase